jgi:aspartyl-tRNA(Asn)/glutamyl-tRNA(Gln) amidotransferase subunit B
MKIGLEIHVQLNTSTKLFCGCQNKFTAEPNTQVCDYCIGLPGTKPRLNEKAVEYAIKIGLALNCRIPKETMFSRKTYFYPDMGKDFQITQYEVPVAEKGFMKIGNNRIDIARIQIEEDPARIVHVGTITHAEYLLLDYNRSGVPLCEIVTEPQFTSSREARLFLQELSSVLQYLDVFDPNIEGSMRVDANISMGSGRVEVKNVSGFKDVEKALNYEILRQKNLVSRGKDVARETRGWDADAGVTRSLRSKEEEDDYGYIIEPDLPMLAISKGKIQEVRNTIPELAGEKLERYVKELKIGLDLAISITSEPDLAGMFESVIKKADSNLAAKWFSGEIKKTLNYNNIRIRDTKIKSSHIIKLLDLVKNKSVTETTAELMLREMISGSENPESILGQDTATRIYDPDILQPIVEQILGENPQAILDYKTGKKESMNFLIGQAMKKTRGRGDSETIRRILEKFLI